MQKKITTIRLSTDERRYARALSLRKGCRLSNGSVAYALKWLLHKYAEKEEINIGKINEYRNRVVYTSSIN